MPMCPPRSDNRTPLGLRRQIVAMRRAQSVPPLRETHVANVTQPPSHMPKWVRRTAATASGGPLTSTCAAAWRPKRYNSSSPGGPLSRAVGEPDRTVTRSPVPAHSTSSPYARSRRLRKRPPRRTFRHSPASMAGPRLRTPSPLALRTSSWWMKNSLRFAISRTHPMRKNPTGGPDWIRATSSAKSERPANPARRRSANRSNGPGRTMHGPATRSCSRNTR